jgi:hypothetical protein
VAGPHNVDQDHPAKGGERWQKLNENYHHLDIEGPDRA